MAAALAIGAGPASAGPPVFGCYAQGGSLLFVVGTPADKEWVMNVRNCVVLEKVVAHIAPLTKEEE
jgi:hypothetical protein